MNKTLKSILTIIIVVAGAYYGNKAVQSYLGKQVHLELSFPVYSLQEAQVIAKQENKLILADYSAIWCPSCRKLDTQVFSTEIIASKVENSFVFARLDYDTREGQDFAATHELVGFPRVLVLNADAEKVVEMPLIFDPLEYRDNLDKVTTSAGLSL